MKDTVEVLCTFRRTPQTPQQSLAENSRGLQLATKTLAATRTKKHLQGIYEAIFEGATLVKMVSSAITTKHPRQEDTVLHKSEKARFGTSTQAKIPFIQSAAREMVIIQLQHHMNLHQEDQSAKLKVEKTIQKTANDSTRSLNLARLLKVNRTKILPKRKFPQSPQKGKSCTKSQKKEPLPDSPKEAEDNKDAAQMHRNLDDSNYSDYNPLEDFNIHEVTTAKKPRGSNRPTKKPTKPKP